MADLAQHTLLALPPMPLATGQLLVSRDDGQPLRVAAVELLLTTVDSDTSRVLLQERHGAWWPTNAACHLF